MQRGKPQVGPGTGEPLRIVPANEAFCEDLQAVLGGRGYAASCQCQRRKFGSWAERRETPIPLRVERLESQTHCGYPSATTTAGLVAYLGDEPVGWCAVEPRSHYGGLRKTPVPWKGRDEDPEDDTVWAVTCFVTRAGFRRRGVARAMAQATVEFARERGARALEGYPMIVDPGQEITWGELNVGSRSIFAAAGFEEVSRPTLRRCVMRIDFD
ncbi:MAG TPA: GNAT family N-acetyltransferase [Solirubrobacteraceae bacterium]|jgi:GNAT superfamily N-acetyltransferase